MAKIEFPEHLKQLLEGSHYQAPIRALADRVGEILADNKLPFFPDYTDHGTDHINAVLESQVALVPEKVWEKSKPNSKPRLLRDVDAVVIIGATLLHDIAMHLREEGFLELVNPGSRFKPLLWFDKNQEAYSADWPWDELWQDYVREARRFSDRDLTNIIGEIPARNWKFDHLPAHWGQWQRNHYLVIGEFIRRHHARLAHEIAIYGFPGLPVGGGSGQFPAMGKEEGHVLKNLADLIGLSARSHGMSLRVCKSYLDWSPRYAGPPQPMGSAVLYPMALLRVADYLQIDQQRAPAILLQLRNPQSPVSVQEWKKHLAVINIGPGADPHSRWVEVSPDISLSIYLQLEALLNGIQKEIDHSTAVLGKYYGPRVDLGLNELNLSIRRVDSNLHKPVFKDSLPYIPAQTGFAADPNLLTLLVEPLYGKHPNVGVRELIQNAVDAVRELEAWCLRHYVDINSLDLSEIEGDVLIELIERENETWFLRIQDRGIGMTSDTIQQYFLRAGASYRRSPEWAKEFLDESGQPRVLRAGKFGLGAFAIFLLGSSFKLWTRYVGANKSMGYMIEASANSQLIEIRRTENLPIGTTIEADLDFDSRKESIDSFNWFCWDWPRVGIRKVGRQSTSSLEQKYTCPIYQKNLPPEWTVIHPNGFDAVYWTFEKAPSLSCNGMIIKNLSTFLSFGKNENGFEWSRSIPFKSPNIAILDRTANLALTIQRYELTDYNLPFIDDLVRDVILSFIAYALVCGPRTHSNATSFKQQEHPLGFSQYIELKYSHYSDENPKQPDQGLFDESKLRWCFTHKEFIPADPWLYSLLNTKSCVIYGALNIEDGFPYHLFNKTEFPFKEELNNRAFISLFGSISNTHFDPYEEPEMSVNNFYLWIFLNLASDGVKAVSHNVEASYTIVSLDSEIVFDFVLMDSWEDLNLMEVDNLGTGRRHYEIKKGYIISPSTLIKDIKNIELIYNEKKINNKNAFGSDMLFVTEIKTRNESCYPESLIAKIWNECLGTQAIPFDPTARKALIEHGRQHPELKRHIKAWEEMKRTGSKWVTKK